MGESDVEIVGERVPEGRVVGCLCLEVPGMR